MTPAVFAEDLAQGIDLIRREPEFADVFRSLPECDVLRPALLAALDKLDDADGAFTLALPGLQLHVAALPR